MAYAINYSNHIATDKIVFMTVYLGAGLRLRHIRNGVELDPIDINLNYDFNFQQINYIPNVQVLPVS